MEKINKDAKTYLNNLPYIPSTSLIRTINKFCNSAIFYEMDCFYNYAAQSESIALIDWTKPKK